MLGLTLSQPVLALRGPSWTPAGLFGPSQSGLWLEMSRKGTLWQNTGGTVLANQPGDVVALVRRQAGSSDPSQSIGVSQPLLGRVPRGGKRNLLTPNLFPAASHTVRGGHTTTATLAPNGTNEAVRLTNPSSASTGEGMFINRSGWGNGSYTLSLNLKSATLTSARVIMKNADSDTVVTSQLHSIGPSWTRRSITGVTEGAVTGLRIEITTNGVTGELDMSELQIEAGAAATGYQQVNSTLDATEAGRPDLWFLRSDGVNDSLNVTLPSASYTRAWLPVGRAVQIQDAVALSGSENVLRATDVAAVVYISRGLTAAEKTALTQWWSG